ncbi:MAG: MATE family efflux transporter [Phycisphaeraceae bacterium]|nr:MATE family efflux transporter [Phycisphaeraceae bacterium]
MHPEPTSRPAAPRSPLVELMTVAAPSIAAMMSYPLKQFVDARMVSELGSGQFTAQGDGGIVAWVYIGTYFSALSIISTYVAQHLGAGRPERGAAYLWNGLFLALLGAVPAFVGAFFIEHLFGAFFADPERVEMASLYCRVLLLGAFFPIAARVVGFYFYGMHKPSVVFIASLLGALTNIVFNYALIFGHWGFPELGLRGAALGTVIASAVEFTLPMAVFCSPRWSRRWRVFGEWRPSRRIVREIIRVGWPGGVTVGNEMTCWAIFMAVIIGRLGEAHSAASWIALRYMTLSFQPTLGLQMAVSAVVGRHIGARDRVAAEHRAWLGMKLGMLYMATCAVLFVVFRDRLFGFFITDEYSPEIAAEILKVGGAVMICAAFFQLFDAMAIIMFGALRGAGDTVWPGLVSAAMSWILIIGVGGSISLLWPELGAVGPWIGAALFITALGTTMVWRFARGPWREIELVREPEAEPESAALPEPAGAAT